MKTFLVFTALVGSSLVLAQVSETAQTQDYSQNLTEHEQMVVSNREYLQKFVCGSNQTVQLCHCPRGYEMDICEGGCRAILSMGRKGAPGQTDGIELKRPAKYGASVSYNSLDGSMMFAWEETSTNGFGALSIKERLRRRGRNVALETSRRGNETSDSRMRLFAEYGKSIARVHLSCPDPSEQSDSNNTTGGNPGGNWLWGHHGSGPSNTSGNCSCPYKWSSYYRAIYSGNGGYANSSNFQVDGDDCEYDFDLASRSNRESRNISVSLGHISRNTTFQIEYATKEDREVTFDATLSGFSQQSISSIPNTGTFTESQGVTSDTIQLTKSEGKFYLPFQFDSQLGEMRVTLKLSIAYSELSKLNIETDCVMPN